MNRHYMLYISGIVLGVYNNSTQGQFQAQSTHIPAHKEWLGLTSWNWRHNICAVSTAYWEALACMFRLDAESSCNDYWAVHTLHTMGSVVYIQKLYSLSESAVTDMEALVYSPPFPSSPFPYLPLPSVPLHSVLLPLLANTSQYIYSLWWLQDSMIKHSVSVSALHPEGTDIQCTANNQELVSCYCDLLHLSASL